MCNIYDQMVSREIFWSNQEEHPLKSNRYFKSMYVKPNPNLFPKSEMALQVCNQQFRNVLLSVKNLQSKIHRFVGG